MAYTGGAGEVATAIKALVQEVVGTAKVFDYSPLARDWKQFLSQFQDGDTIQGWTISRQSTRNKAIDSATNEWTHTMLIRGYFGLNQAAESGKIYQVMVDDVVNKFDGSLTLGGVVESHDPAQAGKVEERAFGGVLVHYCEIRMDCTTLVVRTHGG